MKETLTVLQNFSRAVLLAGVAVASGLAMADGDAATSATSVSVANTLGVQRIKSDLVYTPLAVCFGETSVLANLPVNLARQATNLVFTANLEAGDQLWVYDHDRGGYVSYKLVEDAGVKSWEPVTTYAATGTEKDDLAPLPDQTQAWGYGFWLYRSDVTNRADRTICLSGQVPVNQVTIMLAPTTVDEATKKTVLGKTLVGNPLGVDWDLNDTSVFDWATSGLEENAFVQLTDRSDGSVKLFYWQKGSWSCRTVGHTSDPAVLPAGSAAWFVRSKKGTSTVIVSFSTGL